MEHDENLIPEESNETREKGIYRPFSENKVFEIFRDMANDYGNPIPSLFVPEHLSPQSKEDASELLRTEQRFIAGGRAASFRQGRKTLSTATI